MESELDKFLRCLQTEKGFSPGTIEAYRLDIERGLIPFLHQRDRLETAQVTKDDIRAYLAYLDSDKGNCIVTRARKLAAIKSFFNYLVENDQLKANPASSIKCPRVPEKEPIYLTDEECLRLLGTVSQKARPQVEKRDVAMIVLFLHTGIRVSELVNLKLGNIDLNGGQIKIRRKGNKEQYLPLNAEAVAALASYVATRPESQNGTLFVGTASESLDRRYVYGIVRRYLDLAGIDKGKGGPHLFRHTFCTRLHQKGVAPFVIRDLAGHKSLSTTMRYVKIRDKEQAEAVARLEFGALGDNQFVLNRT